MSKNFFICYSREDYEFIASFQLEFNNFLDSSSNDIKNLGLKLDIDKSQNVIRLGDRYKDKIETTIEKSIGSILFISRNFEKSEFINNVEIPKILDKKLNDPSYIILPIFIDRVEKLNPEIYSYQAPNSENIPIREQIGDLKSLIYKNFINNLCDQMLEIHNTTNISELKNVEDFSDTVIKSRNRLKIEKFSLNKKIGIGLIFVIGILYSIMFPSYKNNDVANIPIQEINQINDEALPTTTTLPENSTVIDSKTWCVTDAKEAYINQFLNSEFKILDYSYINQVSCDDAHDAEVFFIIEENISINSEKELILEKYYDNFQYCFDEFKNISGYSPFESSYVIEILIFEFESNLDYSCIAIYIDDSTQDWEDIEYSFTNVSKENLYNFYEYSITSQNLLSVGECGVHPFTLVGSGSLEDELNNNLVIVSCNEPHSFEVVDKFIYTPDPEKDLKTYEDELSKHCSDNADTLYSDFPEYSSTYFLYLANSLNLSNKEETVVQCLIVNSDSEYSFWTYTKFYSSIREKLQQRSYQLDTQNLNLTSEVANLNCPTDALPAYTEENINDDDIEVYDHQFSWTNIPKSENAFIYISFYDAVNKLDYKLDLNTFQGFEIYLSNWTVTIPIAWEYLDSSTNNFGKIEITFFNGQEIIYEDICNFELFKGTKGNGA